MTPTDNMELKPLNCPWCGKPPTTLGSVFGYRNRYVCYDCRTAEMYIEDWNTRARPSVKGEEWKKELADWLYCNAHEGWSEASYLAAILDHAPDVSELEGKIGALEDLISEYKASALLEDSTGDCDGVTPDMIETEITGLRNRITRLEEALRKFAQIGDFYRGTLTKDDEGIHAFTPISGEKIVLTVGDCRKARSVLSASPEPTEGKGGEG